jgi:excinuclease ABC subunit C
MSNLKTKLSQLSLKPGVYLMRDRLGKVIYVGKARSLAKRVRSYFQAGRRTQMDPKTRSLVDMVADIETFVVKNEAEAILLEGKLIKQYKPRYNIIFRDDKRFLMVKLTRETFPRFVFCRIQKPDGCRYFGPFSNSGALRYTLDYIKRKYHIRTCNTAEPGEKEFKHCLDHIIRDCAAPCVHRVERDEYHRWVERACAFLEGDDLDALQEIEEQMNDASARQDFEKAASLRDTLYYLKTTVKQSSRKFVRDMPRRMDPDVELAALASTLELPNPPSIIEGFDISHIHGTHTVGSMVQFRVGRPNKTNYRHFTIRGEKTQPNRKNASTKIGIGDSAFWQNDDYASMREIVGRRYRRLRDEGRPLPDLVLIDGGRGQLNAARSALREVGVELNIIGLAKEEEEIYIPGKEIPLKLEPNSPALHLLQRVRDESHRFANTLHESWRRKQIRNSILDDITGLGSARKQMLLKEFGSLDRLKQATMQEIAEVEGFGEKTAMLVWKYLHPQEG